MQKNLSCSSPISLLWPPSAIWVQCFFRHWKQHPAFSIKVWLLVLWNRRFSKRFVHQFLNIAINSAKTFFWNDYLDITNFLQDMPVLSSISEKRLLSIMSPSRCTFHCSLSTQRQLFWSVWQNMVTAAETEMPDLPFLPILTSAEMNQLISCGLQTLAGGTSAQCSHPSPSHCLVLFSFLSIKANIVPMPSVRQNAARTSQYPPQHTMEPCRLNAQRNGCKGREKSRCRSSYRWD